MKILVIGGNGREHAICWKIASELVSGTIYAIPGNGGISEIANLVNIPIENHQEIAAFAKREKIDLTIVGPELPLADGIVDIFQKKRLKIFGPNKKAATLESSKIWAKEFMLENEIPTAEFFVADNFNNAKKIIEKVQYPVVIKFDGLAAGKGVLICTTLEEAQQELKEMLTEAKFGAVEAVAPPVHVYV